MPVKNEMVSVGPSLSKTFTMEISGMTLRTSAETRWSAVKKSIRLISSFKTGREWKTTVNLIAKPGPHVGFAKMKLSCRMLMLNGDAVGTFS